MASNASSLRMMVVGGYTALLAGFMGLAVLPYLHASNSAQAEIVRLTDEIAARESQAQQLDDIARRIKLIDLQTRNYDRLVPANQDLGPFLSELSRQLDAAGMKDISVAAMPPTPLGRSQRLPIEVHGRGSFAQFHSFLTRLENLQRLSSVGRLTVSADNDMSGMVNAQITLYIYNTSTAKTAR